MRFAPFQKGLRGNAPLEGARSAKEVALRRLGEVRRLATGISVHARTESPAPHARCPPDLKRASGEKEGIRNGEQRLDSSGQRSKGQRHHKDCRTTVTRC